MNLVEKGRYEKTHLENFKNYLKTAESIDETINNKSFVIEAVVEKLDVKLQIFEDISKKLNEDVVLATNSSFIPASELAKPCEHPSRFINMHFFYPPIRMDLVEISYPKETSKETIERTQNLGKDMGRTVVTCKKETPGFIVNRMLAALTDEAYKLYDEGIADNASGTSNNDNQTYTIFIDNITSTDSVYAAINAFASTSDMSTVVVEDNDVSGIGVEYVPVAGDNESFKIKFFLMSDPEDNVTLSLNAFDNSNVRFSDNGTADNGTSMTVNLTWADNASIYLTNASRNIDNESDDDDLFIDNLTIFSFYGTASCSRSTCDKYNNKQLAKTLIRNIQTGSVYTDFDNATQMPK